MAGATLSTDSDSVVCIFVSRAIFLGSVCENNFALSILGTETLLKIVQKNPLHPL